MHVCVCVCVCVCVHACRRMCVCACPAGQPSVCHPPLPSSPSSLLILFPLSPGILLLAEPQWQRHSSSQLCRHTPTQENIATFPLLLSTAPTPPSHFARFPFRTALSVVGFSTERSPQSLRAVSQDAQF